MKQIDLNNEIVIYQSEDGKTQLDVKLEGETVWLNRQQLAELFGRDVKTIGKHINNALKEELDGASSVVAKFATTAADGKNYQVEYYNLEMVTSVGYRVKSRRGIQCAEREVWLLPSLRQREGRLFQELHRADLSDLRRCGSLSQCRGEGRHATLSRHQEPFLQ